MQFVEVLVASSTYHKNEPLTYASETALDIGSVVVVRLRKKEVVGIVVGAVERPKFEPKPIVQAAALPGLPPESLKLLDWMRDYYPAPLGITTQLFLPSSLPKKPVTPGALGSTPSFEGLPPLTQDQ